MFGRRDAQSQYLDRYIGFFEFEWLDFNHARKLYLHRLQRRASRARDGQSYYENREAAEILQAFWQNGLHVTQRQNTPLGLDVALEGGPTFRVTDRRLSFEEAPKTAHEWRATVAYIKRSRPNQTSYPEGSDIFNATAYAYATAHGVNVEGYAPPDHMIPLIREIQQQERQYLAANPQYPHPRQSSATTLLAAIWSGDAEAVHNLLSKGHKANASIRLFDGMGYPDYTDRIGPALITNVRWHGHQVEDGFHEILVTGNPLMDAVLLGDIDVARMLIRAGADAEYLHDGIEVRQRFSIENGQVSLALGSSHIIGGFKGPVLDIACAKGDVAMVRMLLVEGASPKSRTIDIYHVSPLETAAATGNVEIVRMLLATGIDCQDPYVRILGDDAHYMIDGPLKAAAAKGHDAVVKLLLESGSDARNVKGWYLDDARKYPAVMSLLIADTANRDSPDVGHESGQDGFEDDPNRPRLRPSGPDLIR